MGLLMGHHFAITWCIAPGGIMVACYRAIRTWKNRKVVANVANVAKYCVT
jgi:hypothetical protein